MIEMADIRCLRRAQCSKQLLCTPANWHATLHRDEIMSLGTLDGIDHARLLWDMILLDIVIFLVR
jgi:hypothetical protein